MSLIYDALKQQSAPASPDALPPRASWWARQSPQMRNGMLLGAGALLALPLAFLLTGKDAPAQPAAQQAETAALAVVAPEPAAPVPSASAPIEVQGPPAIAPAAPVPSLPEPVPAPVATVATIEAPAQTAAPMPAAIEPAGAPIAEAVPATVQPAVASVATSAPASEPYPQSTPITIKVEQRSASGQPARTATDQDEARVHAAITAVESAMAMDDIPAAQHALARLESVLPAESLTLLRMRAWVAHGSRDMDTAERLYRQIVERVPDDANAGVNIALLDARRGDYADARHRLVRLSGRHPRSPQVTRALAELDAMTQ